MRSDAGWIADKSHVSKLSELVENYLRQESLPDDLSLIIPLTEGIAAVYDHARISLLRKLAKVLDEAVGSVAGPSSSRFGKRECGTCDLYGVNFHKLRDLGHLELLLSLYEVLKNMPKTRNCEKCGFLRNLSQLLKEAFPSILEGQNVLRFDKVSLASLIQGLISYLITNVEVVPMDAVKLIKHQRPSVDYWLFSGVKIELFQSNLGTFYRTVNAYQLHEWVSIHEALSHIAKNELSSTSALQTKLKNILSFRESRSMELLFSLLYWPRHKVKCLAKHVAYISTGLGPVFPFLMDKSVEEFFINGPEDSIYVVHKDFGNCYTNVFATRRLIESLATHLRLDSGYRFNFSSPVVKSTIVTNDFNIRISAESAPLSPVAKTYSIRKLNPEPFSIVKLIQLGTISSEVAAYCILSLLRRRSFTIFGESGSGKTTLAIALDVLTPPHWRKVCVENEIAENVDQASLRKNQLRVLVPAGASSRLREKVLMSTLHKSPSYLFLGEILDSVDAHFLLLAASAGLKSIHTCHANNFDQLLSRWIIQYGNSPRSLMDLDIFVLMRKTCENGRVTRKVTSVIELDKRSKPSSGTFKPLKSAVEVFRLQDGKLNKTMGFRSFPLLREIKEEEGLCWVELLNELFTYSDLLESLIKTNVEDYRKVVEHFYALYEYLGRH